MTRDERINAVAAAEGMSSSQWIDMVLGEALFLAEQKLALAPDDPK